MDKRINEVTFFWNGKVEHRFISICPDTISWLEKTGYYPVTKYDLETDLPKHYDDYFKKEFGGYVSVNQIWARSENEGEMVYLYEVNHP